MASILWKGPENGLNRSTVVPIQGGYRLAGTVLTGRNDIPLEIRYVLMTDGGWRPRDVGIHILGGEPDARLALASDGEGTWTLDRRPLPDLAGCLDVSLGFSPAWLSLVINRLAIAVGESAHTRAISIGFPGDPIAAVEFGLDRETETSYRVNTGDVEQEVRLNADGFAVSYANWEAVASR